MSARSNLPTITVDELSKRIERQDAFVIDLRGTVHGDEIYGSIRYEPKKLTEGNALILPLPKGSGLIVLYDEDGTHARTREIGAKLIENGYGEVRALEGGFAAWRSAKGKMQERSMEQPVPDVTEHQITR